jgi:hypothetical protein
MTKKIKNQNVTKTVETTEVTKKPGRPVDLNSPRQLMLKEKQEKREQGLVKRGRPVKEGSKRQEELKRKAEMVAAGILTGKRGRPSNPESDRQKKIAEIAERKANGTFKLGRPKVEKEG